MYNSTLILQDVEFIKNDKFSMDFTICKMSSEFVIPHFAEFIARSRGHVSGPASAHVRTPDFSDLRISLNYLLISPDFLVLCGLIAYTDY